MDPSNATTLATVLALATTLVGAIAFGIRERTKADRIRAEADRLRAEADKQESEDTGKVLLGAEANAAQLREFFKSIQARLDRCERRHDERDERDKRRAAEHASELEAKERQIAELMSRVRGLGEEVDELRASIGQAPRMRALGGA